MTATASGLHQRRAAGEQKECNGGMTQRENRGDDTRRPRGRWGSIRNMLRAGCYQFSNAILLGIGRRTNIKECGICRPLADFTGGGGRSGDGDSDTYGISVHVC